MMKLHTKIMLLVCSVVLAILLLNQYPVSMSMRQTVMEASASALVDISGQAAIRLSSILPEVDSGRSGQIRTLAGEIEGCSNCSGLAVLSGEGEVYYNSPGDGIASEVLEACRKMPLETDGYKIVPEPGGESTIYVLTPVQGENGEVLGRVLAKLRYDQIPDKLHKAQRDLNAMTMLVMLIAVFFVWDLTDNIKGTMFNLEPVEIAQLLVERNALIDAVRDGILSVDRNGTILHVNRTALQLCRQSIEDFDQAEGNFSNIFPNVPLQELLQKGSPQYDTECLIGQESFYANFIPIKIEKPEHESLLITFRPKQEVVRFAEDITGVKSYIEALRAQMHEFNNKLQVVAGLVREKQYQKLEEFVDSLIHLKNREMLQINQKIKDPILAAFILSKFDRAAEEKVDLILTDRTQLKVSLSQEMVQDLVVIIGNLLENAFSAVQNCAMKTVTLEIVETRKEISVSVWDSGVEIPAEIRDSLFDYGVTTKETGHGIGLYLVRQACNRYHGYVTVISNPQDGTEFTAHILQTEEGMNHGLSCFDCGR